QGRHDDGALARQRVEEWDPSRQAPQASEKSELRTAAFRPDPAGKPVQLDGRCLWFGHNPSLGKPLSRTAGEGGRRASDGRVRVMTAAAPFAPSPQPSPPVGEREFTYYSAAIAAGRNDGSAARSARAIGCGHQRSSHSAKRSAICGITFSAKSLVLYWAR